MDKVVQASVIENIADGPVECQIVVTGDGFAVVGQGTVEKVVKGKGKKRGRYKKIDDLMVRAATVLVAHGFRPLELMRLFQLPRRTSYRLEKTAREEIEKIMEASERKRREQERISAARLREEWEGEPGKAETARMKEGYSLREARSFKQ
ncbi:MAG: hypothetical protein V3W52_03420 [Syntrophobacteria bacterium]|jgi:hypothetical protein